MNYDQILQFYPWLIQRNQNAIISFDTDGWITGVLLSEILDWKIVGYYDSENLILKHGIQTDNCVFIDVEIFRNSKRSFGHHLIMYDFKNLPADFNHRTEKIFNPNFIRRFDTRNYYRRKYPLATFHLYDKILRESGIGSINLENDEALSVVWFIDGLSNFMDKYKPNIKEWSTYLKIDNEYWYQEMYRRGQRNANALARQFINEVSRINNYSCLKRLNNFSVQHLESLVELITRKFQIENKFENFCSEDYIMLNFNRIILNDGIRTQQNFDTFWNSNPFSMSTYFQNSISYTLEEPHPLP